MRTILRWLVRYWWSKLPLNKLKLELQPLLSSEFEEEDEDEDDPPSDYGTAGDEEESKHRSRSILLIDSKGKVANLLQIMTDPKKLEEVRHALLTLHKALLESERIGYEQTMGAIKSPNHFLQLLTGDPWFAWLQPISQLIVSMDVALDAKESLTAVTVRVLLKETKVLLAPSESGQGFARHYFDALQRDPNVIFAHAEVTKLLGRRKR